MLVNDISLFHFVIAVSRETLCTMINFCLRSGKYFPLIFLPIGFINSFSFLWGTRISYQYLNENRLTLALNMRVKGMIYFLEYLVVSAILLNFIFPTISRRINVASSRCSSSINFLFILHYNWSIKSTINFYLLKLNIIPQFPPVFHLKLVPCLWSLVRISYCTRSFGFVPSNLFTWW